MERNRSNQEPGMRTWGVRAGLLLLTLCFMAAAPFGHLAVASGAWYVDHEAQRFGAIAQGGLHLQATGPSENVVPGICNPPSSTAKDRTSGFAVSLKASQREVRTAAARSDVLAHSSMVPLRRWALLFPFHFFW
ncbi:MAG: hypothetical protein IPJ85_00410 [Flavobacteriales bacterium]|nr:hypothetical protein [Flavobacteriales bacterium]